MWLFYIHNAVKIQTFLVFPLAESIAKAFIGYFFGTSRKKASTLFYGTAQNILAAAPFKGKAG